MSPPGYSHWFWAKLGNSTWPEKYHPVICHLIDVGQAALALWDKVLRDPVRHWAAGQLGLDRPEDAGQWIAFWTGAHDIGKVTPCFQYRDNSQALKSRLDRLLFPGAYGNPHHTLTGAKILASALAAGGPHCPSLHKALARKIAVCVSGHHGAFPPRIDYNETDSLGAGKWIEARGLILEELARLFDLRDRQVPRFSGDNQSIWIFLAGLTAVADWIGSNTTFFPIVGNATVVEQPYSVDHYFTSAELRAATSLEQLGWLGRPRKAELVDFTKATGIGSPRPLQEKLVDLAREMATSGKPGIVIVEAPMGEGKTEAAWYVADCWDRKGGAGTYVALPTMLHFPGSSNYQTASAARCSARASSFCSASGSLRSA